jgi:hypothetical protein
MRFIARSKLKNAKPQILHAMTGVNTHIKGAYAHTFVAVNADRWSHGRPGMGVSGQLWSCGAACRAGRDMSLL